MPTYPAASAPRLAYDSDGTAVFTVDGVTSTPVSAPDVAELNNSSGTAGVAVGTNEWLALVFPATTTLDAIFAAHADTSAADVAMEYSLDSTDGEDGTWTATADLTLNRADQLSTGTWRSLLLTGLTLSCRAIRIAPGTTAWRTLHLHGYSERRGLEFRAAGEDSIDSGALDWGATARGSSDDALVAVANTTSLSAVDVVVSVQAAEDSNEFAVSHYLSTDGRNFYATVDVGRIGPGARSVPITVRRVTPSTATLGARAARLFASAGSWE